MESISIFENLKRIIRLYSTPKFLYLNKFIKTHPQGGKIKVLDIGCGNRSPSLTVSLFPKIEYYGLDKEDYNLTVEDLNILENRYFKIDLEDLSDLDHCLRDNYFDFVIMNHVIEHTKNGLEILKTIAKKIKIGGVYT